MPESCFSYSTGSCFGYATGGSCFGYPAGAPRATYDLPGTFGGGGGVMGPCFSYSSDVPLGVRNRGAVPSVVSDIQRMQIVDPCFSY
jgi:hypothetical protein